MRPTSVRTKAETQFLFVAGALVFLVGGPAIHSLIKEPIQSPIVVSQAISNNHRAPASFEDAMSAKSTSVAKEVAPAGRTNSTGLVEFNCSEKEIPQEVDSGHVRIAGSSCRSSEKLTVLNKTNGFSATVIFTKNRKFTTDFIDLKEGENSFEITSTAKDGSQQTRFMKVVRRVPANTHPNSN